jgi:hypothetical protein
MLHYSLLSLLLSSLPSLLTFLLAPFFSFYIHSLFLPSFHATFFTFFSPPSIPPLFLPYILLTFLLALYFPYILPSLLRSSLPTLQATFFTSFLLHTLPTYSSPNSPPVWPITVTADNSRLSRCVFYSCWVAVIRHRPAELEVLRGLFELIQANVNVTSY